MPPLPQTWCPRSWQPRNTNGQRKNLQLKPALYSQRTQGGAGEVARKLLGSDRPPLPGSTESTEPTPTHAESRHRQPCTLWRLGEASQQPCPDGVQGHGEGLLSVPRGEGAPALGSSKTSQRDSPGPDGANHTHSSRGDAAGVSVLQSRPGWDRETYMNTDAKRPSETLANMIHNI